MNRVLIVDDKPENRYLLRALFEGHGFAVVEARHGAEALTVARANPPQLIVSDLLMPVMDGYTLLHAWKSDEQLRLVPFVVYTATYTDKKDEELALSLGADAFILKPTEPEPFMARVQAVLTVDRSVQVVLAAPSGDETANLRQYNETLIRKLEEKMHELQRANLALTDDIRKRQGVELALREQTTFLDAIIANEPECVKVIDAHGRLELMNPAGLAMLEVATLAEAQQGLLLDFLPMDRPEHRTAYIAFHAQVCNGASGMLVYPIIGRCGTRRWLESHATPLRDLRSGTTMMLSITRDITERLRLEEELRQAQKMEAIGRLAGGIAHDFNNQLTVIQGFGSLVLSHATDEKTKKYAAHIMQAAERSAVLVRQLLIFSRKGSPETKPVDVHALIDETITVLERSVSKIIVLKHSLTAADARVMGDGSLLQNALLNLVLNARDALPNGGEIHIATALVNLDATLRAQLVLRPDADARQTTYLRITISDTGHGMSPEVLSRIFEPFFTTKSPGHGTGLGLASAHSTVRQHGGDIVAHSTPGQGTTFHLYLPLMATDHAGAHAASTPQLVIAPTLTLTPTTTTATASNHHVLVIDDEVLVASFVEETLSAQGYRVTCMTNPLDGVGYYRLNWRSIDLIILDLNMPVMSGVEVFAAIRRTNPQARVLLATGYSDDVTVTDLLRQGARGLLAKPFRTNELAQHVAQNLR